MPRKTNLKEVHFTVISQYSKKLLDNKKTFTYYDNNNKKLPVGDLVSEINAQLSNLSLKPLARNTITKYIPIDVEDTNLTQEEIMASYKLRKIRKDKGEPRKDKSENKTEDKPEEKQVTHNLNIIS